MLVRFPENVLLHTCLKFNFVYL